MMLLKYILHLSLIHLCIRYKILLMFPFPFKSHEIIGSGVLRHLVDAGHEVTFVSVFSVKETFPSIRNIVLGTGSLMDNKWDLNACLNKDKNATDVLLTTSDTHNYAKYVFADEAFIEFLSDKRNEFDIIIIEWMHNEIYSGYFHPKEVKIYEKIFGPLMKKLRGKTLPSYADIRFNASMALSNTHISMRDINVMPESYKAIGGYHIDDNNMEPLDKDVQEIMDRSTDGVIIFAMGTTLDFNDIPNDLMFNIIKMFGNLNQTVIWKSNKMVKYLPKNVKILPWFNQQKILAHKNSVLFITHGGVSSVIEGIHYGVPIIGIPAFANQFFNIKMAENRGFGRKVDLSLDMVDDLEEAIKQILNNENYTVEAKRHSLIYHDRLVPPGKELVYWIEYVVKTQGALHLRSPARLVSRYQRFNVDLFAIFTIPMIIVTMGISKLILSKKKKTKKSKIE